MPMKLLKKNEIVQMKQKEQQTAIHEGLKIARKVDSLRETYAQEEASLEQFRSRTIAQIHEETTEATQKRDALLKEVYDLEKRKKDALEPIDTELQQLELTRESVHEEQCELARQKEELVVLSEETSVSYREAREELQRATTSKERANELLVDADQKNKEAKLSLQRASSVEREALSLKERIENKVKLEEERLLLQEESYQKRMERLSEREQEISKKEAQLADRERTLERNIQRYGSNTKRTTKKR